MSEMRMMMEAFLYLCVLVGGGNAFTSFFKVEGMDFSCDFASEYKLKAETRKQANELSHLVAEAGNLTQEMLDGAYNRFQVDFDLGRSYVAISISDETVSH